MYMIKKPIHLEVHVNGRDTINLANLLGKLGGDLGALNLFGLAILHGDDVLAGLDAEQVGTSRVVVGDSDGSKELEADDIVAVLVEGGVAARLVVAEEELRKGGDKLHLQITIVVDEEGLGSDEHELPDAQELGGGTTETSAEATSLSLGIGELGGSKERRTLHQRAAVDVRVHVGEHTAALHLEEELFEQLTADKLEVVLVRHVHPDTLVLEPSRGERHHAAHVVALSLEVSREKVHLELVITKSGVEDLLVKGLQVLLIVDDGLHLTNRTLKEDRESSNLHGTSIDEGKTNVVLALVLGPLGDLI